MANTQQIGVCRNSEILLGRTFEGPLPVVTWLRNVIWLSLDFEKLLLLTVLCGTWLCLLEDSSFFIFLFGWIWNRHWGICLFQDWAAFSARFLMVDNEKPDVCFKSQKVTVSFGLGGWLKYSSLKNLVEFLICLILVCSTCQWPCYSSFFFYSSFWDMVLRCFLCFLVAISLSLLIVNVCTLSLLDFAERITLHLFSLSHFDQLKRFAGCLSFNRAFYSETPYQIQRFGYLLRVWKHRPEIPEQEQGVNSLGQWFSKCGF